MKFIGLVKKTNWDELNHPWRFSGYIQAESLKKAAVALAVSVEGYDEEQFANDDALIEKFIDDGWRFKLIEAAEEYSTHQIV